MNEKFAKMAKRRLRLNGHGDKRGGVVVATFQVRTSTYLGVALAPL